MTEKSEIRKCIDNLKRTLSAEDRSAYDSCIFENVINSPYYKKAAAIFIYVSYNNEADTHRIIKHSLNAGKIVCVPKIISKMEGMKAVRIRDFNELSAGAYGILEPTDTAMEIEKESIDCIFLPGTAFDVKGGRIGYGGGFYDRFLKNIKSEASKIAIGYDFQILNSVPMSLDDEYINGIITEKGVYTIY